MFRSVADFTSEWKGEYENTLRLLNQLTDESLLQKVSPDGRTMGFIARHLSASLFEMAQQTGLKLQRRVPEERTLAAAEIAAEFHTAATDLERAVPSGWTNSMLSQDIQFQGRTCKVGYLLSFIILHHVHHRGQITVLMRQAGIPVNGVYGPSREEWFGMGMPPQP